MTQGEFQREIERLAKTFGDKAYPAERVNLMWRDMGGLPVQWFSKTVDKLISEHRHAPLPADFREAVSQERERNHDREKVEHKKEAQNFYMIASDPGAMGQILTTILDRMYGKVTDQVWEEFTTGLTKLSADVENSKRAELRQPKACDYCFGQGIYLCQRKDGAPGFYAFRCACPTGQQDPRTHIPHFKQGHATDFVYSQATDTLRSPISRSL